MSKEQRIQAIETAVDRGGGIVDAHGLEFDTAQHKRQLAEGCAGDDRAVRGAAPVTRPVGGRYTHRHRGQQTVAGG